MKPFDAQSLVSGMTLSVFVHEESPACKSQDDNLFLPRWVQLTACTEKPIPGYESGCWCTHVVWLKSSENTLQLGCENANVAFLQLSSGDHIESATISEERLEGETTAYMGIWLNVFYTCVDGTGHRYASLLSALNRQLYARLQ